MHEILISVNNEYKDNYDHLRFGLTEDKNGTSIKKLLIKRVNRKGYYHISNSNNAARIISEAVWINDFAYLFDNLEDEESKDLLIRIVAYRLLGHRKVKLPLNTPEYWNNIRSIESHQSKKDVIDIEFMNFKLPYTDLNFLSLPMKMYNTALGINVDFIIKQYELRRSNIKIEAEPGDVVIDGGGCFGDTALYFANKVGEKGKVHVFEFIPDNLRIFKINIDLNQTLSPLIILANHPLWSDSGIEVYYQSNGPGSKVSFDVFDGYSGKVTTISIDDYVEKNNLAKIDFIKMDIEGAELKALHGAIETIKKFKPKLSIALYHQTHDFDSIPRFLLDLNLGYRFYLTHSTIYGEETMLFATTRV